MSIVTFFESVKFAVVGTPISINLRFFIPQQNAPHCPFAIDETTVSHLKKLVIKAAGAPDI